MDEHMQSMVSNGAPTRTRLSFKNNDLGAKDSNKIVIQKEKPGAKAIATGSSSAKGQTNKPYKITIAHAYPILQQHWGNLA